MIGKDYKAVIFDLDRTLYDEDTYLKLAYRNIADNLGRTDKIKDGIYNGLWEHYKAHGRKNLYSVLCNKLGNPCDVEDFLSWHRGTSVVGKLTPYPFMVEWVKTLHNNGVKLALFTSGEEYPQREKIKALDEVTKYMDDVVIAKKPDGLPILDILRRFRVGTSEALMVGDHSWDLRSAQIAKVDFFSPNSAMIR